MIDIEATSMSDVAESSDADADRRRKDLAQGPEA